MEVVGVEEVAEEGASRKPKPPLKVREEHYIFAGLRFRLNLIPGKSTLNLWRDPVCPV